jgi:hypothetical protein
MGHGAAQAAQESAQAPATRPHQPGQGHLRRNQGEPIDIKYSTVDRRRPCSTMERWECHHFINLEKGDGKVQK